MNLLAKSLVCSVGVLVFALARPVFSQDDKLEVIAGIVTGLDLVLEHHPDGSVKTHLTAERAQPKGAIIDIGGMKVVITTPTGEVETVIEADTCQFDKARNLAQSDGPITLTHPDMVVTGVGFRWSAEEERIEVLSKARVVFKKGLDTPLLGR
jgi:hypothetical protein